MSAIQHKRWTAEEYLAFERDSEEKHEFVDGEIYLMSGASQNHNKIVGNTIVTLGMQLRNRPCEFYPSDMRVRVARNYTYPDVTVVCGTPEFEDSRRDTLLNPTVIVEVLSPSTERYDRGRKFHNYRGITSLQEYVLISQDTYRVERYLRQPNDEWLLSIVQGVDGSLNLTSIGCTLALADVYDKVVFDATEPPASPE